MGKDLKKFLELDNHKLLFAIFLFFWLLIGLSQYSFGGGIKVFGSILLIPGMFLAAFLNSFSNIFGVYLAVIVLSFWLIVISYLLSCLFFRIYRNGKSWEKILVVIIFLILLFPIPQSTAPSEKIRYRNAWQKACIIWKMSNCSSDDSSITIPINTESGEVRETLINICRKATGKSTIQECRRECCG